MTLMLFVEQDREEDQVGTADGWLELHDSLLQKQLFRWIQTGTSVTQFIMDQSKDALYNTFLPKRF